MVKKIFAWIMVILNIIMVFYVLVTPDEYGTYFLWTLLIFVAETYISIKYLESVK